MNCIGYLKILPLQGTHVNVSIRHSYGKLGTAKKSLTGDSIFVPLQSLQVLTIGRGSSKNIQLNNPTVSINHALIWCTQFDEDSSPVIYVHDQSRNTIWHNGTQMGKGVTTILNDGDIIKIQMAALITFKGVQDEITLSREANLALEDWQITNKLLGSGSFGSVFVAKKANCSKLFAVKIIQNNRSSYFADNDLITHESELLSKIKHPNIINVHNTIVRDSNNFIFQDLACGGDLFSYLVCDGYLRAISEKEAILIVFQLMKALHFLHKHLHIIHRDIKLDNVLLELPIPQSKIYLCDFGIAKYIGQKRTRTCVGTLEYSAPEVFKTEINGKTSIQPYGFKSDMWSLGIVTHILLSGISPFYSDVRENIINGTRNGKLNFNKPQFQKVSQSAKSFIKRLLVVDPQARMDINDCFEHVWIKLNRPKLEKFYRDKIV